ncbi:MAG: ABC transporter permease [Deltaproteobacteria bacterium]|nr:ABC transporter permease [Deltaproteobacteria bacterium]
MDFVRYIGGESIGILSRIGRLFTFLVYAIYFSITPPFKIDRILRQIRFIGAQSTLVVLLIGTFTGMVISLQGYHTLSRLGSEAFLGPMVALSIMKEMAPVLTGLMVTARAGSALTAEIGIMRITNQIDAIEMMGLNPFRYLIAPNMIAGFISLPLLTGMFDAIGILGGYLVGVKIFGLEYATFFGEINTYVWVEHLMEGIYKSMSFGIIISWVSCYMGYYTGSSGFGAEGVSKSTTSAVVLAAIMILIWDYFMTAFLF